MHKQLDEQERVSITIMTSLKNIGDLLTSVEQNTLQDICGCGSLQVNERSKLSQLQCFLRGYK